MSTNWDVFIVWPDKGHVYSIVCGEIIFIYIYHMNLVLAWIKFFNLWNHILQYQKYTIKTSYLITGKWRFRFHSEIWYKIWIKWTVHLMLKRLIKTNIIIKINCFNSSLHQTQTFLIKYSKYRYYDIKCLMIDFNVDKLELIVLFYKAVWLKDDGIYVYL